MALPTSNRPLEGQHLGEEGRHWPPGVSMFGARQRAGSAKEPAGRGIDDERIADERVSEGNTTKTGGEGPYALLQGRGGGRRGSPRRPAQPLSLLFYDSTQSRSPEDGPRCNCPNCLC